MKKYVIRVLRNDGSLYNEEFETHMNDNDASFHFNSWWLFWGNTDYSYELRRYYKNGNTGKKIISSHYNVNYKG